MARYFMEVAYKGTNYSGFQTQENANTIQAEIENAFQMLYRLPVVLTGSSRTDTGVHAAQNFFHFNFEEDLYLQTVYKLNSVLPKDIAVKNIYPMPSEAHSRFDAISRKYIYKMHRFKNPFLIDASFYFPYRLNMDAMQEGAAFLLTQQNFFAFAKTNTQAKTFDCNIIKSEWSKDEETLTYTIEANRFLRGMVRLITGSLLKLGRDKITMTDFQNFFQQEIKAGYSVPAHGLYLKRVKYPKNFFPATGLHLTSHC